LSDSNPLPIEIVKMSDHEFKLYVKRTKQFAFEMVKFLAELTEGKIEKTEDIE